MTAKEKQNEEKIYGYALHSLPGIGDKTILKMLDSEGSVREIYESFQKNREQIRRQYGLDFSEEKLKMVRQKISRTDPEEAYRKCREKKIEIVTVNCREYPEKLKKIPDPPFAVYVMGSLPREDVLSVAVVGARECSAYGEYIGKELGTVFGENGIQVISGMARGIDGISQEAAMRAGGRSFGILGCGVDICYPAGNRRIYGNLIGSGGIISTYLPGTLPKASNFPPRNRIVSGFADAVIVVEARQKSGTLITVDMALEQGKEVYVVPGRITDRLSDGCNRLLKQGAGILLSPEDFLQELDERFRGKKRLNAVNRNKCTDMERPEEREENTPETVLLDAADYDPMTAAEILERSGLSMEYGEALSILMKMSLQGKIRQVISGYFEKV